MRSLNTKEFAMSSPWLNPLSKLHRDHSHGGAPHKPILLLAIFSLIRKGIITSNKIEITPELVMEFKEYWREFVVTPHVANFALPFFHMKSEKGLWKLVTYPGVPVPVTSSGSIKSFKALRSAVQYAELDQGLFILLLDEAENLFLSSFLIETYFKTSAGKSPVIQATLFSELEHQILSESKAEYASKLHELQQQLSVEEFEEEVYLRGGVFKREIPKIYNYRCAVSRMRIETAANVQMVDACHIIPFSKSNDDTIRNGICLSPNLHRAFDRGLITISRDYTVVVTSKIKEMDSPYSISQFSGAGIQLPENLNYAPDAENLSWHSREVFLG